MNHLLAFFVCCLLMLGYAAIIAAIGYALAWFLAEVTGKVVPPKVVQLLGIALAIFVVIGMIDCFSGGHHFMLWSD